MTRNVAKSSNRRRELHGESEKSGRRANRFHFAEVLLEIAIVLSSLAILSKALYFFWIGAGASLAGVLLASTAFLLELPESSLFYEMRSVIACSHVNGNTNSNEPRSRAQWHRPMSSSMPRYSESGISTLSTISTRRMRVSFPRDHHDFGPAGNKEFWSDLITSVTRRVRY